MSKIKGFTLIELLVVVAIIGILAAVGTVAYTGYTKAAKAAVIKAQHAQVVKYVTHETARCYWGGTDMDGWYINPRMNRTPGRNGGGIQSSYVGVEEREDINSDTSNSGNII